MTKSNSGIELTFLINHSKIKYSQINGDNDTDDGDVSGTYRVDNKYGIFSGNSFTYTQLGKL